MNSQKRNQLQSDKPYEGYGEEKVSWYVDVPKRLALEFDRLFPDRGSHVILVVTAINHALRVGPKELEKLYDSIQRDREGDLQGDDRESPATTEDGSESSDLH